MAEKSKNVSELEYCIAQLKELIELARKSGDLFLVYLLELAMAEAFDEINKRRQQ